MAEKRKDNKGRNLLKGETQRKDGRYLYQYQDSNGKRKCVYAWDLAELRDKEKQITIDTYEGIESGKADKITVNVLFDRYLESKKRLRETTLTGYKYSYEHFVKDKIGNMPLSSVKYSTIEDLYNNLLDGVICYGTLEIINNVLHPMFELAVRDDIIRKNPTQDIMKKIRDSHDIKSEKRFALTPEEQEAFIEYTSNHEYYSSYMPLFTTLLGTGCRIGEIMGLTWDDVDFKSGTININHTLTYKVMRDGKAHFVITPTKTNAGTRTIPMLEAVKKALKKQREKTMMLGRCTQVIDGYTDFVFTTSRRTAIKPNTINRVINSILKCYEEDERKKAKKEHREPFLIRHFSVHNFRHTFATNYCQIESNLKTIQEIMGHSDISITMNIYAECTENTKKTSFENMEGKFKIG